MAAPSKKRRCLTLSERVDVVERSEKGESARSIATKLGVGKTQIQAIVKDKEKILERWREGSSAKRRRLTERNSQYSDVNSALWDWFTKARSRRMIVTGPLLQEKARALAKAMGHNDFMGSNGWLEAWKRKHGTKYCVLSGKGAFDNDTSTSETLDDAWEEAIFRAAKGTEDGPSSEPDEKDEEEAPINRVSVAEALEYISGLKEFALQRGMQDLLELATKANDIVSRTELVRKSHMPQASLNNKLQKQP